MEIAKILENGRGDRFFLCCRRERERERERDETGNSNNRLKMNVKNS